MRRFLRKFHRGAVDLADLRLELILAQHDRSRAKSIRLDHVAPNGEEAGVDVANDVWTTEHEQLIAAFLAPEIVERGLAHLYVGAHRAVVDHDALSNGF